jgi:hypothetical protein
MSGRSTAQQRQIFAISLNSRRAQKTKLVTSDQSHATLNFKVAYNYSIYPDI